MHEDWGFIHYFILFLCFKIPLSYFEKNNKLFKTRKWEQSGQIWQKIYKVKKWKSRIIEGSSIAKERYDKSHLHGTMRRDISNLSAESIHAERTHNMLINPQSL